MNGWSRKESVPRTKIRNLRISVLLESNWNIVQYHPPRHSELLEISSKSHPARYPRNSEGPKSHPPRHPKIKKSGAESQGTTRSSTKTSFSPFGLFTLPTLSSSSSSYIGRRKQRDARAKDQCAHASRHATPCRPRICCRPSSFSYALCTVAEHAFFFFRCRLLFCHHSHTIDNAHAWVRQRAGLSQRAGWGRWRWRPCSSRADGDVHVRPWLCDASGRKPMDALLRFGRLFLAGHRLRGCV